MGKIRVLVELLDNGNYKFYMGNICLGEYTFRKALQAYPDHLYVWIYRGGVS
jgi:hypothetical protein